MTDRIGKTLGRYRIVERIGGGGMATVYKAYQPAVDRYVALKVISQFCAQDPEFRERFRREARAVARLEHAHILPVHDYGEAEGCPYLVMRYLEAGTLKDRLAQGPPLSLQEVKRIVGQIGSALDYAHRQGVIHRDVKPSNILLDAEGNAFLTDFGVAKMTAVSTKLTQAGVGVGTPVYMSPEQGQGANVDPRTDVYSLGVMLFEMVTGRVPFQAETPLAVVLKHINAPLPLPRSIRPDLPEAVERVLLRALAKDPADRFPSAVAMVEALDTAVQQAGASASARLGRRPAPAGKRQMAPAQSRAAALPVSGWRALLAGALAVVSLAIVLGSVQGWWGRGRGTPERQAAVSSAPPGLATHTSLPQPSASPSVPAQASPTATSRPSPSRTAMPLPTSTLASQSSDSERARAFAQPILAALGDRPPDFEDDFSDPSSGWSVMDDEQGETGYAEGEYFIVANEGEDQYTCISGSSSGMPELSDFVLEVDGGFVSGQDGNWYVDFRLWFESQDNWGTYELRTGEGQETYLVRLGAALHDELIGSPRTHQGWSYEKSHLLLVAHGAQFALQINGRWVGYASDPHFVYGLASGALYLKVCRVGDVPVRAKWDDLRIWDISSLPVAPASVPTTQAVAAGAPFFVDSGQRLGGLRSLAVALGDLDGDGDLDAFVANGRGDVATQPDVVWLNDGLGYFSQGGSSPSDSSSEDLTLGDLDGDGDLDAFVTTDRHNRVLRNDGRGSFADTGQQLGSSTSTAVELGDLDGDGDLDAFVGNGAESWGEANTVWWNDGIGTFRDSGQRLGNSRTQDVALGDVDGDGDLDAFAVNAGASGGPNSVWLNDGSGTFRDSGQALGNSNSFAVALGDLDGDGDLDALVANAAGHHSRVWYNDGLGRFVDSGQQMDVAQFVALGDLDGDGDLDALLSGHAYLNNGAGRFTAATQQRIDLDCRGLALGDLDGDTDLDVFLAVFGWPEGRPNRVWFNLQVPIVLDGDGSDWRTLEPHLVDTQGDTTGGVHTDVKAAYAFTAPQHVYLMVEVHDPPLLSGAAATVELNAALYDASGYMSEVHTNITSDGRLLAAVPRGAEVSPVPDARVEWGEVLEVTMPRSVLGDPESIRVTFVNLWRDVDGKWTSVDMMEASPRAPTTEAPESRTLELQPGAEEGIDAQLPQGYEWNYGRWHQLEVGSNDPDRALHHSLIKFDLQGHLPLTAEVESAVLELYYLDGDAAEVWVHEVLVPWEEGSGAESTFHDGATWSNRTYATPGEAGSGLPWHEAGCSGSGTDYRSTAEDVTVAQAGWNRWTLSPLLVQRWIQDPESNLGLVITDHDAGAGEVHFASSDLADARLHPRLAITFRSR